MNDKEILEIIRNNDDLNISLCSDDFYIIDEWDDLNKFVSIVNNVPINYVDYGRIDKDMVLNPDKEFLSIDDILKDWGFCDEYMSCCHCNNHIEMRPYGKIDYWINDGDLTCGDCIRDNDDMIKEYINHLINNPRSANTILKDKDIENKGFIKCNCDDDTCNFWNGLYQGANDDPKKILKNAIDKNPDNDYIFDITAIEQFDINFTLWHQPKTHDEV